MDHCEICCSGITSDGLDTQYTISCIFKRLPRYLQNKCLTEFGPQLEQGDAITFSQLSSFIQRRAQIEKSFLGKLINRLSDKVQVECSPIFRQPKRFAVNVTRGNSTNENTNIDARSRSCASCSAQHAL